MSNKIATREAYGKALVEIGSENDDIVVLDADLSKSTKTIDFKKKFPERFFNMGIAEGNMMGVAAGLSTCGKIPFVSSFAMFAAGRAFEQVRNSIGYPHLNVKICATHAGITVGEDGASHQCNEDFALMSVIPGMMVFSPSDGIETYEIIKSIAKINNPCYVRLGRMPVNIINDNEDYKFEIGKAIQLRQGTDVTLIATGIMVEKALGACDVLRDFGIKARVLNIHTIKPIDVDSIVKAAKETKAIITCEEHSIIGGLGSLVSEVVLENYPVYLKKIGIMDTFTESGKPDELLEKYGLTQDEIVKAAKEIVARKKL